MYTPYTILILHRFCYVNIIIFYDKIYINTLFILIPFLWDPLVGNPKLRTLNIERLGLELGCNMNTCHNM